MSPVTHFLVGWAVAQTSRLGRRERAAIAVAGVAPDLDGVGLAVDLATRGSAHPTELWGAWHHVVGHGLAAAVVVTAGAALVARRRALVAALAFVSFHLHVLGDLVGARGPDGDSWEIHYLWPFVADEGLSFHGQWALNAWPNFAITALLLAATFFWSWRRGFSPLEMISPRADGAFVATLRARFGDPR